MSQNAANNQREPYRIGVLMDMPGFAGGSDMYPLAVKFALEEAYEQKLIDRPAEVILRSYLGQPWGDGLVNRRNYLDLVQKEQVLGISGPFTTDNCMSILNLVEEQKVPVITICG